jgi:hypothetical protein
MELKNAATGLGWDDANQTVACSDTWWDEHLAVSQELFCFQGNSICLYSILSLTLLFFFTAMQQP